MYKNKKPLTRPLFSALALLIGIAVLLPAPADAQFGRLREAAERAVENEAVRQTQRLIRNAIRCAIDDPACASANSSGEDVVFTDREGEVIVDDDGAPITDREQAARRAGVQTSDEEAPEQSAAAAPADPIGTVETTLDGQARSFAVVGFSTSGCGTDFRGRPRSCQWGSGWRDLGSHVSLGLWALESAANAGPDAPHLQITLSIWTAGDPPNLVVEPLTHRCGYPGDNGVQLSLGSRVRVVGDGDCGGIVLDSVSYDEAADEYVVAGSYAGTRRDTGETVEGRFEARVPPYPG